MNTKSSTKPICIESRGLYDRDARVGGDAGHAGVCMAIGFFKPMRQ